MFSSSPEVDRDDRLNTILLEYVEAVERGEAPDRKRFLDQFPEFADELSSFFATRDQLDQFAAPLRAVPSPGLPWQEVSNATILTSSETPPFPKADVGRVGDFRLLREVGRGGMGVVYEAEQVSLRRRVALKVLPFAAAVDPRHLQRFRNEAQAAAQLHHSHIVPVYAVGAEGGVHYYAMQFIDGQSLAQLLNELRGRHKGDNYHQPPSFAASDLRSASESPQSKEEIVRTAEIAASSTIISTEHTTRRRDYFRRVAELIRQVADALEYAHQVGIIHRDIKPANLLLDAGNRLWVTDFGLALIRNDVGLTATGELIGTLRYMSPEQALGKAGLVDHRSDLYSLGVTLYELLTLTPALNGEDRHVLLRQLAEEDPQPPSEIDQAIPGELETIVLKATAKLPSERYASAREFADDLQRFLDDRPILARRPTLVDRIAKWGRRHRTATLSAVLVLLLAAIGLGVSTTIIAAKHAETKAAYQRERIAKEQEQERAREAEDHYRRTRRAVDLFVELSDEGTLDFPPLVPVRQRLLEAAVAYYQELNDLRADTEIQKDLKASRDRLARLQAGLSAINEINSILLLDQQVVQTHLNFTPEQSARLAPLLTQLKNHQQIGIAESGGNKRQQIAELAAQYRGEVERILSAAQYRQLQQVYLQLPGPHVFSPAIIATLGMTESQKSKVREIQSEAALTSLKLFATGEHRQQAIAEATEVWKTANERIVASFVPTQRTLWNEMTGPLVPGELRFPLPPRAKTD